MIRPQSEQMERITFRITPTQKAEIDALVESGEYPNRSEAIRAAVREMVTDGDAQTESEPASDVLATAESR